MRPGRGSPPPQPRPAPPHPQPCVCRPPSHPALSPHSPQKKDADTWFRELDVNKDNAVNFEEFLALVVKVGIAAHEDIHKDHNH